MELLAHGATLAFAWFLAVNVSASILVIGVARMLTQRSDPRSTWFWLALRLLPAAAATSFVLFLFVPSYWRYEPREFVEGFDLSLIVLACCAGTIIAGGAARGVHAWRSTARRTRRWLQDGRPIRIAGTDLPAFEIEASQPMLALAGVVRPKLLVTRGLIDALTPAELHAAIAHELGHFRALDNLKRLVLRAAPDVLAYSGVARAIERQWASAAEHAADRHAGHDGAARCALASALLKVARLTPRQVPSLEPISTFIPGGEIASRVRQLLDDSAGAPRSRWLPPVLTMTAGLAALVMAYAPLLRLVHEATELVVHTLP